MSKNFFQDIADKLQASLPDEVKNMQEEAERLVKERIDAALANFKLVRYDDFEIQQKVLLKTREKLEALTQRVEMLETLLATELAKNGDIIEIDESLSTVNEQDSEMIIESTEINLITTDSKAVSDSEASHHIKHVGGVGDEGKEPR